MQGLPHTLATAAATAATASTSNTSNTSPNIDNTCKWDTCNETFDTIGLLYRHVEDEHIGRQSLKNRCLECKWENCSGKAQDPDKVYKRRHQITSHMKSHVQFKEYFCEFVVNGQECGDAFTRKSDMRKHQRKIHKHTPPKEPKKPRAKERRTRTRQSINTSMDNVARSPGHPASPSTPSATSDRPSTISPPTCPLTPETEPFRPLGNLHDVHAMYPTFSDTHLGPGSIGGLFSYPSTNSVALQCESAAIYSSVEELLSLSHSLDEFDKSPEYVAVFVGVGDTYTEEAKKGPAAARYSEFEGTFDALDTCMEVNNWDDLSGARTMDTFRHVCDIDDLQDVTQFGIRSIGEIIKKDTEELSSISTPSHEDNDQSPMDDAMDDMITWPSDEADGAAIESSTISFDTSGISFDTSGVALETPGAYIPEPDLSYTLHSLSISASVGIDDVSNATEAPPPYPLREGSRSNIKDLMSRFQPRSSARPGSVDKGTQTLSKWITPQPHLSPGLKVLRKPGEKSALILPGEVVRKGRGNRGSQNQWTEKNGPLRSLDQDGHSGSSAATTARGLTPQCAKPSHSHSQNDQLTLEPAMKVIADAFAKVRRNQPSAQPSTPTSAKSTTSMEDHETGLEHLIKAIEVRCSTLQDPVRKRHASAILLLLKGFNEILFHYHRVASQLHVADKFDDTISSRTCDTDCSCSDTSDEEDEDDDQDEVDDDPLERKQWWELRQSRSRRVVQRRPTAPAPAPGGSSTTGDANSGNLGHLNLSEEEKKFIGVDNDLRFVGKKD